MITCTAPGCAFPATYEAKGEDDDGAWFVEHVCRRCADSLAGTAAECGKPCTLEVINRKDP